MKHIASISKILATCRFHFYRVLSNVSQVGRKPASFRDGGGVGWARPICTQWVRYCVGSRMVLGASRVLYVRYVL